MDLPTLYTVKQRIHRWKIPPSCAFSQQKRTITCALMLLLKANFAFAIEDITRLTLNFSGQFIAPTCDARVYDANNVLLPSGVVSLPTLDSDQVAQRIGAVGERVIFKIGPANPQACMDLLSTYLVDVSASGYTDGNPNVLVNLASNGPSNIGVEVLTESGASILPFASSVRQTIVPGDTNSTLVGFSAQLYNRDGQAPDKLGLVSATAIFTTAYQ